jgi:hypothetical protein
MGKIVSQNEAFLVIDDVLCPEDFASFLVDVDALRFNYPQGEWNRIWQLTDPQALSSGSFYLSQSPIGYGMDKIALEFSKAIEISKFYGARNDTWTDLGFRVYKQARGSKLTCHSDSPQYVGAGVYYCHSEWRSSWGGELFFPDISTIDDLSHEAKISIDKKLQHLATGRYVSPKPNRMVLINSGVLHSTNRIDPDAGNNIRTSVSAFLLRKDQSTLLSEGRINIGD